MRWMVHVVHIGMRNAYKTFAGKPEGRRPHGRLRHGMEDNIKINIVAHIVWRLYKTGIGLTTGFIGSHTVTHNYSVYTSQLTIAAATLL
jgi:hypothetical protein